MSFALFSISKKLVECFKGRSGLDAFPEVNNLLELILAHLSHFTAVGDLRGHTG